MMLLLLFIPKVMERSHYTKFLNKTLQALHCHLIHWNVSKSLRVYSTHCFSFSFHLRCISRQWHNTKISLSLSFHSISLFVLYLKCKLQIRRKSGEVNSPNFNLFSYNYVKIYNTTSWRCIYHICIWKGDDFVQNINEQDSHELSFINKIVLYLCSFRSISTEW